MTLLYYDPVFLEHDTGGHPENAGRLRPVIEHLNATGDLAQCKRPSWPAVTRARLEAVHTGQYIDSLDAFAKQGGGRIERDTMLSPRSYEVALMAAGAACDAVLRVGRGEDKTAFCLVRPPGHHALSNQAMGFCLFNNIAIAARMAVQELNLERALIVDWDVHHGNGTQAIFWEDRSVGFFSIHRSPFYPNTGFAGEIGAAAGLGTTRNLPIRYGTSRMEQLAIFEKVLTEFASKMKPQLLLISAGFDSHKDDPIGSLGLESEDFIGLTHCVLEIANQYADGRVVSLLEGGYNPTALTECVELHLRELLKA